MKNIISDLIFLCADEGSGALKLNDDSLSEYYKKEDEKYKKEAWGALYGHLGEECKDLADAIKDYYSVFDPSLVVWLARLYEPRVGGIYYSNSAKDTEGYAPDVESTAQGFSIIPRTGMAYLHGNAYKNVLPRYMLDEVGRYIKSLQDPNGFFYNYQWTKESHVTSRLSRDLSSSLGILGYCGMRPTYNAPTGEKGDGIVVDLPKGVTRVVSDESPTDEKKPSVSVSTNANQTHMEFLESIETLTEYLEGLKASRGPLGWYYVGSTVNTLMRQIKQRDKELSEEFFSAPENEGKTFVGLTDTVINFFNENQSPLTGGWEKESGYLAVNAILKITGVYNQADREMHYHEKLVTEAFAAVLSDTEGMTAVVDVYNPWSAVGGIIANLREHGKDEKIDGVMMNAHERADKLQRFVQKSAVEAVYATKRKLEVFKKADGSFSYLTNYSAPRSQRMPVAVPESVEGDVNATELAVNATTRAMLATLGLADYRINVFGATELKLYLDTLEEVRRECGVDVVNTK